MPFKIINDIGANLKKRRIEQKWSQSKLAYESQCSLATIQNIEAGNANPEIETLMSILNSLGQKISIIPKTIDFTFWPSLGLPLFDTEEVKIIPSKELLLKQLQLIELQINIVKEERFHIALTNLLLALKSHFPQTYSELGSFLKKWLDENEKIYSRPKLRRIAIERLATYL